MITEIFYREYKNAYPFTRIGRKAPDNFKLCILLCWNIYKVNRQTIKTQLYEIMIHSDKFDVFLTMHHSIDSFQITNLIHNSFIL